MRIHVVQHVVFEGPGAIADWARERGHSLTFSEQWRAPAMPKPGDFDFLVVMGGPMSANDEAQFAWLAPEKRLIRQAFEASKAILGVCLGAQLLANVLGARVYRNKQKEIGWFPVRLAPEAQQSLLGGLPEALTVLHWHGETFDLPQGAVRLASSGACANQAFEMGDRALGLQFHLEVLPEGLEKLIANSGGDLVPGPLVQSAGGMRAEAVAPESLRPALYGILDRLAATLEPH